MESQILRWFRDSKSSPSVLGESWLMTVLSKSRLSSFSKKEFLFYGKWLMAVLVFFCVFLPRISLGSITPFYSFDLRGEDLPALILTVFLLGMMIRRISLPEIPSVEGPFLLFLLAGEISILNGLWMRTIDKPFLSLFYLLKWAEYFFIFLATARLTANVKQANFFLQTFFWLGIALGLYGWWEHFFPFAKAVYPNYYRIFERLPFHGDANHVGGLLVLWLGFFIGVFLRTSDRRTGSLLLAALIFVFFPLIWTYSRKSYFALGGALLFPFIFKGSRKKLLFLISLLILTALVFPTRLSERLMDLREAFQSVDPFHSSWAGNWVMWKDALWNFDQFFLWGSGLGSRHRLFYESQYVLILAETGIFGFSMLVFLFLSMIREITSSFARTLTAQEKGIAIGWLIGFVGLLIHNLSCVSLTVAKIAIPFWFLSAVTFQTLKVSKKVRHSEGKAGRISDPSALRASG